MKVILSLAFCLLLLPYSWAQHNPACPLYAEILEEANALLKVEKYIDALNKLNTAREYCPDKAAAVDREIEAVVAAVVGKLLIHEIQCC